MQAVCKLVFATIVAKKIVATNLQAKTLIANSE